MKRHDIFLKVGLALTCVLTLTAILSFFWTPYVSTEIGVGGPFLAPCGAHLLGTDNFGRDLLSRVMEGMGATFSIALLTTLLGTLLGVAVGAPAGYFGGRADELLMRFCDAFTAFPSVLLALVFVSIFGRHGLSLFPDSRTNVIFALALVFMPSFARIVRGEFARARTLDYVRAARLMGASHARVMFVHILPNAAPILLSSFAIGFNNAVLAESSMSFLGIGVEPPNASLGYMLSEAQGYLSRAPWYAVSTGIAIALLTLGVGLIAEGLQRGGRR